MKAFQITAAGSAGVIDIPDLTAPHEGELLLRVAMVGLCGTDLNTFRGRNAMVVFPRVPGHEISATVITGSAEYPAGTSVTVSPYTACGTCSSCRNGRANACRQNQTMGVQREGGMTEFVSVAPSRLYTANLSLKELCLVEPLTVGAHAVARGRVTGRDFVGVFGCGGVGLGAVAAAAYRGAVVIAIDMDDTKLEIAKNAGAAHAINTARENLHDRLFEITQGQGPDVMIEAIGLPETFRAAVEEVAFTGRVVYIGYAKEPVAYETRLFVQKELDILGSRNALPSDFVDVIRMLEGGKFPVEATISAVVGLEEVAEVLSAWSAHPQRFTKIMVEF